MFLKNKIEDRINSNNKKIQGLERLIESLDRDVRDLFEEIEVSPQQIQQLLSDPKNFTEEDWQRIEECRQQQDKQLECDLANIQNPRSTQQAYSSNSRVKSHWLCVR